MTVDVGSNRIRRVALHDSSAYYRLSVFIIDCAGDSLPHIFFFLLIIFILLSWRKQYFLVFGSYRYFRHYLGNNGLDRHVDCIDRYTPVEWNLRVGICKGISALSLNLLQQFFDCDIFYAYTYAGRLRRQT